VTMPDDNVKRMEQEQQVLNEGECCDDDCGCKEK